MDVHSVMWILVDNLLDALTLVVGNYMLLSIPQ